MTWQQCRFRQVLLCLFCLAGLALASVPVVASAQQQENTMAPAGGGTSPDEWLANEMQAIALDRHDLRNLSMASERALAEIALRQLQAGESPEQVAEDARSSREALQRACAYGVPLAAAVASISCYAAVGASGLYPVMTTGLCGALAAGIANDVCSAAERRLGLETRPTHEILTGFNATEAGERVWNEGGFSESTGVYLEDDVEGVLEEHPQLLDILSDRGINLESTPSSLEKQSKEILTNMTDMIAEIDLSGDPGGPPPGSGSAESENARIEFWAEREKLLQAGQERLRKRTDMVNARTAVAGAVALMGVAGPEARELGRKTLAVADAALGVQGAVHAFHAAGEIGASNSLASLALSGSLVSVGTALIGSLFDTGPTADEIIIEEIGKLRAQVEDLREEMHKRFDGVHEHLDEVVERLDSGFDLLSEDIADVRARLEEVKLGLREAREEIDAVARGLTFTYVNMTQQHAQLMKAVIGQDTSRCTEPLLSMENVDGDLLRDCRAHYVSLARLVAGDQVVIPEVSEISEDPFRSDVVLHPDRTVNAGFGEFKRLLESSGRASDGLPDAVVGPEAWVELMIEQNESRTLFLNAAERHGIKLTSDDFRTVMGGHRADLREFLQAVEEELRVFTGIDESRETVFSALFGEVRARLDEQLRDLIRSIQDDYYADDALFDGRTRPAGAEGAVIPEIRYEDHPHAWNRMADFIPDFDSDGIPDWLRLGSNAECRAAMLDEQVLGAASMWSPREDAWFMGDRILQFLHGNDLMPVRLGIGNIDVCVLADQGRDLEVTLSSGNQMIDAILNVGVDVVGGINVPVLPYNNKLTFAIWYTPGADTECPRTKLLHEGVEAEALEGGPVRDWSPLLLAVGDRVRERGPVLIGRENASSEASACVEGLYDERFEAKRRTLSDHVRSRLGDDPEFAEITRALKIAHLHLRSWLALALDDARWRSELVEEVLSHLAAFPDLERLMRDTQGQGYAWDVVEDGLGKVDRIEELLSSRRMRDAVLYGAGHRYLTKARFVVLDGPADEIR